MPTTPTTIRPRMPAATAPREKLVGMLTELLEPEPKRPWPAVSLLLPAMQAPEDADQEHEDATSVRPSHKGRDFGIVLSEFTGFHPEVPVGGWRSGGVCAGSAAVVSSPCRHPKRG